MNHTFIEYYNRKLRSGNREGGFTIEEVEELLHKRNFWGYRHSNPGRAIDFEEEVLQVRKCLAASSNNEQKLHILMDVGDCVFERLEHTFLRLSATEGVGS